MRTSIESTPDGLFRLQHGVAADRQLRALGITWEQQRTRLRSGAWRRAAPGVIAVASAPRTWEQRAMTAALSGPAALLSGRAAARLHRLDRIPVTVLPVTLVQLAERGLGAEQALDSALRQRKPAIWLKQHLDRWEAMGSSSAAEVARLLDERIGKRLPRSWFQRLAAQLLRTEGFHLVDEWPVHDRDGSAADVSQMSPPWRHSAHGWRVVRCPAGRSRCRSASGGRRL